MIFTSGAFLFVFLPVAYFTFWMLRTKTQRYVWLTVTGYVFYGFWNYKFCALMALSTLVSYSAGLGFLRYKDNSRARKVCLVLPVTFDLLVLGVFKYFNFGLRSAAGLAQLLGFSLDVPVLEIVLPVGISFYTFHTITYIVDAYRRVITPTRNVWEFSSYVCLFPQLVAGPIVRFRQIEADLERIDHGRREEDLAKGWSFFAIGMIKKVVIADTIANIINPGWNRIGELSSAATWLCALGYTYQLYFDFSGYSDMAVGLGYMLGVRLPQNFSSPYRAEDPSDFWKRWHISLSTVLRDYLYIPLGGNRGTAWRTRGNLMLTMLLGGLWHGANWTFVLWGAYHGLLLVAFRQWEMNWLRVPVVARRAATFLLVVCGWVLFRSDTIKDAAVTFGRMFVPVGGEELAGGGALVGIIAVAAVAAHAGPNTFEMTHEWSPGAALALAGVFVIVVAVTLASRQPAPFLYFQF